MFLPRRKTTVVFDNHFVGRDANVELPVPEDRVVQLFPLLLRPVKPRWPEPRTPAYRRRGKKNTREKDSRSRPSHAQRGVTEQEEETLVANWRNLLLPLSPEKKTNERARRNAQSWRDRETERSRHAMKRMHTERKRERNPSAQTRGLYIHMSEKIKRFALARTADERCREIQMQKEEKKQTTAAEEVRQVDKESERDRYIDRPRQKPRRLVGCLRGGGAGEEEEERRVVLVVGLSDHFLTSLNQLSRVERGQMTRCGPGMFFSN